jgi:glutamate dehydrogenase
MFHKFEEGKDLIIDELVAHLKPALQGAELKLCSEFVRQCFGTVALDDLRLWSMDNLAGAALHFWSTIRERQPNQTKVDVYNPELTQQGWHTSHTVIEVITTDAPFLVDTIRLAINRLGLMSHLIIHMGGIRLSRDEHGVINGIFPRLGELSSDQQIEAPIFLEIDKHTDPELLAQIKQSILHGLNDNHAVVDDWQAMRDHIQASIHELDQAPISLDAEEVTETKAFLQWIEDHHFTFLGMRDYELTKHKGEAVLQAIPGSGLGVLREQLSHPSTRNLSEMTPEARELILSQHILVVSKTSTLATVHRDAYTDYIGIKRFNAEGQVIGERRVIGLYTAAAYNTNPKHIPFLRHKVALIMQNSLLNPRSHAGKVLLNILETFPRDDLIQTPDDELLELVMGIFHMQERRCIRLFARMDVYHRFVSCLVYVPKDRYNIELQDTLQQVLTTAFHSNEVTLATHFSESVLARLHFIIRLNPEEKNVFDFKAIEQQLIIAGRSWTDELHRHLLETLEEEQANTLFVKYKHAFPAVYSSNFSPKIAVHDVLQVERLNATNQLEINFYQINASSNQFEFRLKLYQLESTLVLSDVLPILENLGMRAISERPYMLKLADNTTAWVNEFLIEYLPSSEFNIAEMSELFQQAFARVWFDDAENDGFNQLVLAAGLDWSQVAILRAYAKYFKQIGFTFSQDYIESALLHHAYITKKLAELFALRFDPEPVSAREKKFELLSREIIADLDKVENLDEDKIIRQYIQAITATLRTSAYQLSRDLQVKPYIAFKFNSHLIPGMPRPYPLFEIFVYSTRFEGVHLRCAKVARGGLRWSDRREDFRTEVLGLMKAQQVKNAVIVPSGAKGGFVPKKMPQNASREEVMAEGIACYQLFIRGLLDITDNYADGGVVKPARVICYDEDDPYLVVAADKGTATFSDLANAISNEYGFWLGDAFASGGSIGYDHKKMGITAKGAWESVKRHFYELGVNTQTTNFTVVGIGDMAGDVFGNGMLLSPHICLVGAFNHQHIFVDPKPNPVASFTERQRLFNLPRSSWADYNADVISSGGGVFNRHAKSISLSPEMRELLSLEQTEIEPNELIKCLLRAKIDLLWSAGIGTFVKASNETHAEVGDRTNDLIRIDAAQLQARVVGEGGNLGFTQLARVEYALQGGAIYTDFIDNSAGVSCSDKEVNIKILLNQIMVNQQLSVEERNQLLASMTDEVSALVLRENYSQTRAISLISTQALRSFDLFNRYLNTLEEAGKLDRTLDFIPEESELLERKATGQGLTTPDIAVLLCQSKINLKEAILASDLPEEAYLRQFLVTSFPKPLQERFSQQMQAHPLRREIISTKLSNMVVNEVGFSFVYRLQDETGASAPAIVRAYIIARTVLGLESLWHNLEHAGVVVDAREQNELMINCIRLLRRITRWFLRQKRTHVDIADTINHYLPGVLALKKMSPKEFGEEYLRHYNELFTPYKKIGLNDELAHDLTSLRALFAALDIIEVAFEQKQDVAVIAKLYFGIGEFLHLNWIRHHVIVHPSDNQWEALSREALRDDLDWQQRQLTAGIVSQNIKVWSTQHAELVTRWNEMLANLRSATALNYSMFFVAIRELADLTQTTLQVSQEA